ncbi:MAG: hypothetical protein JRN52_05055, partial [Nitrososphaerota archaeon]|nr:hypothetical protein [Nitrososphaerota archaeon]
CPSFTPKDGFNLFAINYKLPTHTFSNTISNPWLVEVVKQYKNSQFSILVHSSVAEKASISEGDEIEVESEAGYTITGPAAITDNIHSETIAIPSGGGRWIKGMEDVGANFNALLPHTIEKIDTVCGALDACVRVRIKKAER